MEKKSLHPPGWALRFLQSICPDHLQEEVQGDLIQEFHRDVKNVGERKAKRKFVWKTVCYLRPGIVFRNKAVLSKGSYLVGGLLHSYLLTSWRNIWRYRWTSAINIIGLSASMAIGLLIIMVIKNQTDFDTFHPASERLYRITTEARYYNGALARSASSPAPLINYLSENYPSVEQAVRIDRSYLPVVAHREKFILSGAYTSQAFFSVFGFKLSKGNPVNALTSPYAIVLTEQSAIKLFGLQDPIGKILTVEGVGDYTVTGVLENRDHPSHIDFEAYASFPEQKSVNEATDPHGSKEWESYGKSYSYIRLRPDIKPEALQDALHQTGDHCTNRIKSSGSIRRLSFHSQPINEVPFSDLEGEIGAVKSWKEIAGLLFLAFVMLLLAVFNYSNITAARTMKRLKEIGVRKISGARRNQLVVQFMVESLVLALLSMVLAGLIASYLPLNSSFGKAIPKHPDFTLVSWFFFFSVFAGCLIGLLPALSLSKINPVQAFKNRMGGQKGGKHYLRNGLIITQFFLSLVFITVLVVFYNQSLFQVTSDYGFTRKGIIHLKLGDLNHRILINELEKCSNIEQISAASRKIFGFPDVCQVRHENDSLKLQYLSTDQNFIHTYQLQMVAGGNFPENISDKHERYILMNEKAIEALNLGSPVEAIGKLLVIDKNNTLVVSGVFKDFHALPFKHPVMPLALRYMPDQFNVLAIRSVPSQSGEAEQEIKQVWNKIVSGYPPSYSLFEEDFNRRQFHGDDLKMVGSLALIAFVISCLGLLGVVMHSTQQRIREIGIRKVMGAQVVQIFILLSWGFIRLLLLAGCLALPVSYWLGNVLLQNFSYRIDLGIGILSSGFMAVLVLGLVTISSQTLRVVWRNPVSSLRYE